MREPHTTEEWQEAVDGAQFLLALDSCRQYGLIESDVIARVERCEEILERGKRMGVVPASDDMLVERYLGNSRATPLPGLASK